MNANNTVKKRWLWRFLGALLSLGIALAIPTAGWLLSDRNSWDQRESFIERVLAVMPTARPYLQALLVQIVAPVFVAVLWRRHKRRRTT